MLIRVVDLETTGFDPPEAAVCEIGWCDLVAETESLAGDPIGWAVRVPWWKLVNPGHPIPPVTSAVHHIVDADVAGMPPWSLAAVEVVGAEATTPRDLPIAAYAAHSAKFERLFITDEMTGGRPWICTYKCALRLWPDAPAHSNQALRYWRNPEGLDRGIARVAHRAGPDAYVTAFHLRDMLAMAPLADLITWSSEPALQVRCHIGKVWRGSLWTEVDDGFLWWVSERDFDEDVLFTVHHEMDRRQKEREAERAAARRIDAAQVFGGDPDDRIPF